LMILTGTLPNRNYASVTTRPGTGLLHVVFSAQQQQGTLNPVCTVRII
jgi:hypothetical protein